MSPSATHSLDELVRQKIRGWVDSTGTTQTTLAAQIGRDQVWVSRYLTGKIGADLDTLQRMTQAFGHTLAAALDSPADPQEARLVNLYRGLTPTARSTILTLMQQLARRRRRPPRASGP